MNPSDVIRQAVDLLTRVIHFEIDNVFPELASGLDLPQFVRFEAPSEAVAGGNIADPFRPRYAVDLQLLDEDGKSAAGTPLYSVVPLPLPLPVH